MAEHPLGERRMKGEMFALSFTALFLEMMVIRVRLPLPCSTWSRTTRT